MLSKKVLEFLRHLEVASGFYGVDVEVQKKDQQAA